MGLGAVGPRDVVSIASTQSDMGLAGARAKSASASFIEAQGIKLIEITESEKSSFTPRCPILAVITDTRMNNARFKNANNLR